MPTLLAQEGFKFFFYANEHLPMHIHVSKGNGFAKIDLESLRVVSSHLRPQDQKRALQIARLHRQAFIGRWHDFFA